ncbi:GNAT family N-acetyltransferase [Vibrio sp. SM6]|uniref:GNAT family N-acetyltransferase n=1 Tax=Vibrio agarilyticus TaxID=2726741 RepID=A0A7X8TRS5_9VIBR|nr:GNAT family N-acetyltransferase [Vibrio agarilyticus]
MVIRDGQLNEVVALVAQIDEFANKESEASLAERLQNRKYLLRVAEYRDQTVGFKIGYALDDKTFYSWFGGVVPQARKLGVAQRLLDDQEQWLRARDYRQVRVKSRNRFPAMLRLLIKNGYQIEQLEAKESLIETRLHFVKTLKCGHDDIK